jgi:anti-anti-sigma regulatory factor
MKDMRGQLGNRRSVQRRRRADRSVHRDSVVVALRDDGLLEGIAELRWRLDDLLGGGQSTLVIDVSGVGRISSTTVAAMLWAKRRCRARRVSVVVRDPSRRSLDQIRRTGLMNTFDIESPLLRPTDEAGDGAHQHRPR